MFKYNHYSFELTNGNAELWHTQKAAINSFCVHSAVISNILYGSLENGTLISGMVLSSVIWIDHDALELESSINSENNYMLAIWDFFWLLNFEFKFDFRQIRFLINQYE